MPALLVTAILLSGAGLSARAGIGNKDNPRIFPPRSNPYGKTYSKWAAAWWHWVYSIPAAQNPVIDSTGEFSQVGQSGPVFFLAGNFGSSSVRECTVPAGKALLFALLNAPWVQFPTDPPFTISELRDILSPSMDNPTLTCEIDGKAVGNLLDYREQSSVFSVTVP